MVPSVKENLLSHSRYIRDVLAPILAQKGGRLNEQQIIALKTIFASLGSFRMTRELLQHSRIEKALSMIAVEGNAWPVDAILLSEALVNAWEDRIGPLRTIRADLWGPGGRLEGVMKLRTPTGDRKGSVWSVENVQNRFRAYEHGHIGFQVGDWWIKPAAAFRDGIIDEQHSSITADDSAAYAIRLDDDQESEGRFWERKVEGVERMTTRYKAPVDEPGLLKLTKAVLSRDPIRVLRSGTLTSNWAPKAGLRYDGLYRVMGYSLKSVEKKDHNNVWNYHFQLARITDPPQESLEKALAIPLGDQMDDWRDYQRIKADHEEELVNLIVTPQHDFFAPRGESGYFTAHPCD